jgi:hypothetical protein
MEISQTTMLLYTPAATTHLFCSRNPTPAAAAAASSAAAPLPTMRALRCRFTLDRVHRFLCKTAVAGFSAAAPGALMEASVRSPHALPVPTTPVRFYEISYITDVEGKPSVALRV